tara:strand:- start:367 stop:747 length:381 start_codon:yes stop_codon:yes gene_type:complete
MNAIGKAKKVDKEWGYELWLANNEEENYCGKLLYIKKGHGSSMHYHSLKHETFYILRGRLELQLIDTQSTEKSSVIMEEGDTFVLPRLLPHRLAPAEGEEFVEFIEISTFHRDSDSYRVYREPVKE